MSELIIRKTGIKGILNRAYALEIRDHGLGGTDYTTVAARPRIKNIVAWERSRSRTIQLL